MPLHILCGHQVNFGCSICFNLHTGLDLAEDVQQTGHTKHASCHACMHSACMRGIGSTDWQKQVEAKTCFAPSDHDHDKQKEHRIRMRGQCKEFVQYIYIYLLKISCEMAAFGRYYFPEMSFHRCAADTHGLLGDVDPGPLDCGHQIVLASSRGAVGLPLQHPLHGKVKGVTVWRGRRPPLFWPKVLEVGLAPSLNALGSMSWSRVLREADVSLRNSDSIHVFTVSFKKSR